MTSAWQNRKATMTAQPQKPPKQLDTTYWAAKPLISDEIQREQQHQDRSKVMENNSSYVTLPLIIQKEDFTEENPVFRVESNTDGMSITLYKENATPIEHGRLTF